MSLSRVLIFSFAYLIFSGCGISKSTIKKELLQTPPPQRYMSYTDNSNWDELDLQISASMDELKRSDLIFDSSTPIKSEELPERLYRWLTKIDRSGGAVHICPSQGTESSELILAILKAAGEIAFKLYKDELKYQPAEEVNAKVYVKTSQKNADVTRIEFVNRKLDLDTDNCKAMDAK